MTLDLAGELTALHSALKRLRILAQEARTFRTDAPDLDVGAVFTNALDATVYVGAIDEQLAQRHRARYGRRERADPDGLVVAGMRWLRDTHLHRLPITTGRDATPFFPGPPFYIVSDLPLWLPSDAILQPDQSRRTPEQQKRSEDQKHLYDDHLAGKEVAWTLDAALRWFDREGTYTGNLLNQAAAIVPSSPARTLLNRRADASE